MTFAMTASCRLAAALAAFMIFAPFVPLAARAAPDFAPGTAVTVVTGETLLVRSEPSWSAAGASEVAPGAWMGVVSGPHYDADGTPWYEVDAGGFVPAYSLGTGETEVAPEVAYEPEGKEASYDAAQDGSAEAAPVELAAETAPVEVTPAEAPAEAPVPAPETAAYDPANVVATAWIAGTNGDGAVCRAGMDFASAEMGWLAEGSSVDVIGDTAGEWQPVNCGGAAAFIHASFIAWEPPATVNASGDDGVTPDLVAAPAETATIETAVAEAAQRDNRDRGNGGTDDDEGDDSPANGGGGSGQEMADFAMQYVGYPYAYAGEGPYAFDCSGFTMFVAKNVLGMDITHDMFVQVGMGQSVSRGQLQAGDLVFFQNTFRDGLSHSGIYIGGGQFVHAENESTGVRVSDIDSDYYASRWYGGTRLT
ncbi:MAG: hypothetical protein AVDCRST_MAG59-2230 [uncultured Thermomicrobiales bacterium]|uniref:NlpC/P60 domain-containing protein n=1 Tax=uncultured Thermomicrobiales bacterium TaxID=1645740 RepID=A0A6J4UPW4_9BACT|nr:MAG: hypothetical protein AVDCRST_MAG59-2230 [uncultured Thermomicrobiales bacterium]